MHLSEWILKHDSGFLGQFIYPILLATILVVVMGVILCVITSAMCKRWPRLKERIDAGDKVVLTTYTIVCFAILTGGVFWIMY